MSQEISHKAIILKKQLFEEADELITIFTQDNGKMRCLAKSSKQPKSKLAHALHQASLVELTFARVTKLPKVIQASVINLYSQLRQDPERVSNWFVAAELILKATADEQPNEPLFFLLKAYLDFLNQPQVSVAQLSAALIKFKIHFLQLLGLGLWYPADPSLVPQFFSNSTGGFLLGNASGDSLPIHSATWKLFLELRDISWSAPLSITAAQEELNQLLSGFITYQLEREIKSERFIRPR